MKYSELKKQLDELHFEGTNIDPEIVVRIEGDKFGKLDKYVIKFVRTVDWGKLLLIIEDK